MAPNTQDATERAPTRGEALAARTAGRKAERLADAADGIVLLSMMGYLAAVFLLIGALADASAWYYMPAKIVGLLGMMLVFGVVRDEARRKRARLGLPDGRPKEPPTFPVRMVGYALLYLGPLALLAALDVGNWELRVKVPIGVLGLAALARGAWYRRWEDIAAGAAIAALITLALLLTPGFTFTLLFGCACVPAALAGLVKHARWRRWARAMQTETAGSAAGEEPQP